MQKYNLTHKTGSILLSMYNFQFISVLKEGTNVLRVLNLNESFSESNINFKVC